MTKVLYVEDNDDNVYMLSRRLRRNGFEVIVAGNGQEGVTLAESELPDIILMDLSLPVVDGWEATRRLKQSASTSDIPVIALSAHVLEGEREKAIAAGCIDFGTKPIDIDRLLDKIDVVLGRSGPH